jgi:hypothetical protein
VKVLVESVSNRGKFGLSCIYYVSRVCHLTDFHETRAWLRTSCTEFVEKLSYGLKAG